MEKPDRPNRAIAPLTPLTPLGSRPRRSSGAFITWRTVRPQGDESARWESHDGRWVTLTLDAAEGHVIVADQSGRSEAVASFEGALDLARAWRHAI